jgi:predicted SprT family Zn-dependent metalloprotease
MTLTETRALFDAIAKELGLPTTWRLEFDRAVRRFGRCCYRTQTISLSEPLVRRNGREEVEETIRHEIAHALVGPGHGHGRVWKQMAVACGARAERCYSADRVAAPAAPWIGTCPRCKHEYPRHRRRHMSCGRCERRFNPALLLVWRRAS